MAQFEVGDFVVYPAQGVGRVTAIENRCVAGEAVPFFKVTIVETGALVFVPTGSAQRSGIRHVIDDSTASRVFAVFDSVPVRDRSVSWIRKNRQYQELLAGGKSLEVAEVLRDMYRLRFVRDLSFGQMRLLERSRRIIIYELGLALQIEPARVEEELLERTREANHTPPQMKKAC